MVGTIPDQIFDKKGFSNKLLSFSSVSNCFSGSLSSKICNATQLITLALDGLHSSPSCRNIIFPSISDSYILKNTISGGRLILLLIYTCILYMV